jgi:hypothetical protein
MPDTPMQCFTVQAPTAGDQGVQPGTKMHVTSAAQSLTRTY